MTNIKRNIIYSFLLAIVLFLIVPSAKSYASGLSTNKEYYITSAQYSNKVINNYVYNSSDIKNGTTINLYPLLSNGTDDTQLYKLSNYDNNSFLISCVGSPNYTLNISSRKAGTKIICWQNNRANNEGFIITSVGNGYYTLCLANNKNLYLTATSDTKLTLATKSNGNNQKFKFVESPRNAVANNKILGVKLLKQTDSRWNKYNYVTNKFQSSYSSGDTVIHNYGCTLTSMCMIYNYKNGKNLTPDVFARDYMVFDREGYAQAQKEFAKKTAITWSASSFRNQINAGNPVLLKRTDYQYGGQHWAVLYGYTNGGQNNNDFKICDPIYGDITLQAFLSKGAASQAYKY